VKTLHPACPKCSGADFELRFLKEEGLATAKCLKCSGDFLLLDSEDHWFDVIQQGYPRVSRCSCKSTSFRLKCDYWFRDGGDVEGIEVWTVCSGCGKSRRQMSADINYSGTERLVREPLVPCKNPKILYDLQQLTLFLIPQDIVRIVDYLGRTAGCRFVGWVHQEKKWTHEALDLERAKAIVLGETYSDILASRSSLPLRRDLSLPEEDLYWKRHEVIRIQAPFTMAYGSGTGQLYYIQFSNEFVEDETIRKKSPEFRDLTGQFLAWLGGELVTWRGPRCFDNREEHFRLFGDRFRQKVK
jgi:hypothetical protein